MPTPRSASWYWVSPLEVASVGVMAKLESPAGAAARRSGFPAA